MSIFNNWQTIITTFLLEPFFAVLFFYLISPHGNLGNSSRLILTAVSLTAIFKIVSLYSGIFVAAQMIDILKMIFIDIKGFLKFNFCALLISFFVAAVQSCVLLVIFAFLKFDIQLKLGQIILILVLLIIFSSLFAMISSLYSLQANNPYFYSNLLLGLLPIISATIVPLSAYPKWLALISKIFPFWIIQDLIWGDSFSHVGLMVGYVFFYSGLLLLIIFVQRKKILLS
jgi:hypothetical protein